MRILLLHADFIEYQPISKEIQTAEDIPTKSSKKIDEVIVALVAVEKDDDQSLIEEAGNELKAYGQMIKCDNLLVYPYAHLSSNLADPDTAKSILNSIEEKSKNLFKTVNRAPFGWTKSFNIKIKGHPLAEHAKAIQKRSDAYSDISKSESNGESTALKSEEVL
jgi:threonyl-tRNA synthetase